MRRRDFFKTAGASHATGSPWSTSRSWRQGILRAPRALRDGFDATTKRNLIAALESTRAIVPGFNNWLLFSATVEAGLKSLGAARDRLRVDYALRQHEQWYKGDGAYGDGPEFHWDYYNSFVIHPMLVDELAVFKDESPAWTDIAAREERRAKRYAAVQERLIAPDGSFPAIGRSIAYRAGAFHLLAQSALRHALPEGALTAVIRRSMNAGRASAIRTRSVQPCDVSVHTSSRLPSPSLFR